MSQPKKHNRHGRYYASQNSRMRRKMLYFGYQMGYDQPRDDAQKGLPQNEICMQNVSAWCKSKHCSVKKPLKRMTGKELRVALTQFEQVYKSYLVAYAK